MHTKTQINWCSESMECLFKISAVVAILNIGSHLWNLQGVHAKKLTRPLSMSN
jgi:hypothetical protein